MYERYGISLSNPEMTISPFSSYVSVSPILELRLDARAKIVVDGADHIDFMVADLVDIRQRILIDRVDERH